jgi:hypothetical protein
VKKLYALLCVSGLILPYYFLTPSLFSNGIDIPLFINLWFANKVSAFFAVDVFILHCTLGVYLSRDPHPPGTLVALHRSQPDGRRIVRSASLWLRQTEIEKTN